MSTRRRGRRAEKARFDPYFAFLLFVGVGLGTWRVELQLRLTVLWLALLALAMIYAEERPLEANYSLLNLGGGALVGLIVSAPLVFLARGFLNTTSAELYKTSDILLLFQRLVLLAAPIEELYFRGFVQRERGLVSGALLYGLASAVYFLPGHLDFWSVIAVVSLGTGLLGFVYGYICQRYGLSASIACHMVANLVLLVIPSLLDQIAAMLA